MSIKCINKRLNYSIYNNDVTPLVEGTTVVHRTKNKEERTKDYKALYLIQQCVDADKFKKFDDCTSSKEV